MSKRLALLVATVVTLALGSSAAAPGTSGTAGSVDAFGGAWIEAGHVLLAGDVSAEDVRARIDEAYHLGMRTLIVTYVEYEWANGWGPFYPSKIPELGDQHVTFDVIGTILSQASAHGMDVFLGLGRGPDGPLAFDDLAGPSDEAIARSLDLSERVGRELHQLYGHEPSFHGWYITHEMNRFEHAGPYYDAVARILDQFGSHRPVMVAPSGTPLNMGPEALRESEVDIFAYQGASGAGYIGPDTTCPAQPPCVPYTYSFNAWNRVLDLDAIFERYAENHRGTGKQIWANVELWQMDGPTYTTSTPYAATCTRVLEQLRHVSPHVEMTTAYELFAYLRSPDNETGMPTAGAAELWDEYATWVSDGADPTEPCGDRQPCWFEAGPVRLVRPGPSSVRDCPL